MTRISTLERSTAGPRRPAEPARAQAWLALAGLVIAAGMAGAIVTVGSVEAVGLAALAILAVAGLFFVFGTLSGYVTIAAASPIGVVGREIAAEAEQAFEVATADGHVVYANRAAALLRGDTFRSLDALLSGHPSTADVAYRLAAAVSRGEARTEDVLLPALARSAAPTAGRCQTAGLWLRVSVRPFQAPPTVSDRRRLALWSAQDMTADRTQQADAIGRLTHALGFFDTMPIGVAAIADDGSLLQMNATLQTLLGQTTPHASRPMHLGDIFSSDAAALVLADAKTLRADAAPVHHALDLVRDDGRAMPVNVVALPRSTVTGAQTIVILERLAGTEPAAAFGQDDRFERTFHAAPFGIATLDKSGAVINANAAFSRLFPEHGQAGSSIVRRLAGDAGVDQRTAVETAIARALAGRANAAPVEVSSGGDVEIARRLYINPLTVGIDPREAAIIYVADSTEQKALELKFAQSQKMEAVGQLAGGISHDFNNVLTVIITLSEMFLQTRRPTDSGYNDIMQIRSNANRAAGMVRQLLAFSRKQTLEPEIFNVNEVVQDFAFTIAKMIGEKIDLKHIAGRDLWPLKADKTQFNRVLYNLAVNAKDAMLTGGHLRIRTRNVSERESLKTSGLGMQAGEYVLIEVEDTGTGMTPEVMAKIFEPFFTTKDVGKGTGLGLSSVYGIVKQTGGFIYPESVIGKGTTFRVFLPRYIPTEAEEAAAEAATTAAQCGGAKSDLPRDLTGTGRVLLVEDEDGVRDVTVRALQLKGYEVLEATSGADALEVLAEAGGLVDLIVSDVMMPEMDGPTMYKEMIKTYPDLKIVFVSGYPSDAFEKSLGPDIEFAFLAKPFSLPELAAKVKEVMTGR